MLFSGTLVILATQVLGLWSDVVHVHLSDHRIGRAVADGLRALLTGLGTFLFPFLVWLDCVRHRLPLPRAHPTRRRHAPSPIPPSDDPPPGARSDRAHDTLAHSPLRE